MGGDIATHLDKRGTSELEVTCFRLRSTCSSQQRLSSTWRTIHQTTLRRGDTERLELVRLLHREHTVVSLARCSHLSTHIASTSSSICLSSPPMSVYVSVGRSSTSIAFTRASYSGVSNCTYIILGLATHPLAACRAPSRSLCSHRSDHLDAVHCAAPNR